MGLSAGIVIGVFLGFALGREFGGAVGTISGNIIGIGIGIAISRTRNPGIGNVVGERRSLTVCIILTILLCFIYSVVGALFFAGSYILVSYRLPLYAMSCLSSIKAYFLSRKQPSRTFFYLHASSLYWDEQCLFPLPGIRSMLFLASQENVEATLKEINFIVYERPAQIGAARMIAAEIMLDDFRGRDSLRTIAQASQRFQENLPQGVGLLKPLWMKAFTHLNNASINAERACSPLGWQAKFNALTTMTLELREVSLNEVFAHLHLNDLLENVVALWLEVAQQELQILESAPERTKFISNPYSPGLALDLHTSSFVGRLELAQLLSDALRKRPTFLLYGERRMGKSSVLKHLPDLLGRRYITIFYDLQSRGTSSSVAAFLSTVAEGIYEGMNARTLKVKELDFSLLQEAAQKNEATVYYVFMKWFKQIDAVLKQEGYILLLTFDEFEYLEEASQQHYLDINLLLDWFRSLTQNYAQVSLLFSGLKMFGEMGPHWISYFVYVEALKISFLTFEDARKLILEPITLFPGERVFPEAVITEVIRITHGHPFLIQALCSALIDILNSENSQTVELTSLRQAMDKVLKNWGSTYFRDLWERTPPEHQRILKLLTSVEKPTFAQEKYSLGGDSLRSALETLVERDLIVLNEDHEYRIAVPLFQEWLVRISSYSSS